MDPKNLTATTIPTSKVIKDVGCLIVDPTDHTAKLLAMLLEQQGHEVHVVASGEEAIELCRQWRPDIAFLEWELPGIHGSRTAEILLGLHDPFIVMLTSHDSEVDRVTALSTIADDYVTRPFSNVEIVARVRAILRRRRPDSREVEPTTLSAGALSLDTSMRTATHRGQPIDFTRLEFDILASLMRYAPRPVPRKTLISDAWGDSSGASTHTLDVHASRLRRKLGALGIDSVSIDSIRGFGLRLVVREPTSASSHP